MLEPIELEEALEKRRQGALLIDVRTPAEYAETTIPGAVNIPLFSNEQRAQVGTVYKQQGRKDARRLGVDLAAPQIPSYIDQVEQARAGHDGPVIVFCWRGGQRSHAMTTFFNLAGVPARQLSGGHKQFRRHIVNYFERQQWAPIYVARGLTGVGKTRVLQVLEQRGYPVVDLEGLANHRGSAFGALGLEPQPSQKLFDALLWDRLEQLSDCRYLLTEGESLHIGRIQVPKRFHQAMQEQPSLWLTNSLEARAQIILEEYPARDQLRAEFARPLASLKERLGKQALAELNSLLDSGQWELLARELMVRYYDPLYLHTLPEERVEVSLDPFEQGIEQVIAALEKLAAAVS